MRRLGALLAFVSLFVSLVKGDDTYSTLSTFGTPAAQAVFPQSAYSSRYCPDQENQPCVPIVSTSTCLSSSLLQTTLASKPDLFSSLHARFDVELAIETQPDPGSKVLTEVLRLLWTEVMGYSVRVIQNGEYLSQLPRCLSKMYDFHPYIWRTDWTTDEWMNAFSGDDTNVCGLSGPSGLIGRNSWFADTYSIEQAAAVGQNPLDFWRAYTTVQGIAGLPRFNLTAAQLDTVNNWFIPPQCNSVTAICGVAYGFDIYWEQNVVQQQIHNLGLKVAMMFPATHDDFYAIIQPMLNTKQQALFFYYVPDTFSASSLVTRVALPDPTEACYHGVGASGTAFDGIGPVACDFRSQNLQKIFRITTDSDRQDAHSLFNRMVIDHETVMSLLGKVFVGSSMADVACEWVQNNPSTWVSWFNNQMIPRRRTLRLSTAGSSAIYALLALFALISIGSMGFLFVNRNHVVIRRSSHTFNQIIVFGSLILYAALVVGMQDDTKATCVTSQFLLSLGFSAYYGALLTKCWRIYAIFSSKNLQTKKLPDSTMLSYWSAYVLIDLLLVILWSSIDPPNPHIIEHSTADYTDVSQCTSGNTSIFRALLYLLRGIALVAGAFFAVRIRNVDENYNEGLYLAVISYNILVVSGIIVGITFVASNDPTLVIATYMAGISFAVFCSLLLFIIPKILSLYGLTSGSLGAPTTGGMDKTQINDTQALSSDNNQITTKTGGTSVVTLQKGLSVKLGVTSNSTGPPGQPLVSWTPAGGNSSNKYLQTHNRRSTASMNNNSSPHHSDAPVASPASGAVHGDKDAVPDIPHGRRLSTSTGAAPLGDVSRHSGVLKIHIQSNDGTSSEELVSPSAAPIGEAAILLPSAVTSPEPQTGTDVNV